MRRNTDLAVLLLGLALWVAGAVLFKTLAPEGALRALPFLCIGVGCGLFGHGAGGLGARRAVKSDPALARKLEIEAGDERNRTISDRAKAKGYDLMTFCFGALLLFLALMGTDLPVVLVTVALYLFVQFYALWCRLRLEKEM